MGDTSNPAWKKLQEEFAVSEMCDGCAPRGPLSCAAAGCECLCHDPRQEPLTFRRLQVEQRQWVEHNFPNRADFHPLLGAVEELGELAHAHLKGIQGIRGSAEEHRAKAADAVADVIIYLADYCSARGFDMQAIVEETWAKVRVRDWQKNPQTGDRAAPLSDATPAGG